MKAHRVNTILAIALGACCVTWAQTDTATLEQKAVSILLDGAANKDPDTRVQTVVAASLIGPHDKVIEFLIGKLDDKDVQVRLSAIGSLVDLGDERGIPPIEKALESDVPEVAFAAARALYTLKQQSGKEALLAVASGDEKTSSSFITSQKRGVLRQLKTPKSTLMFAFRSGAGFIPVPGLGAGIGAAQMLMSDGEFSGRASAVLLLAREQSEEMDTIVRLGLSDKDWTVRAAAVQAIAFWNRPELKAELVPLFEDKKDKVRFRAAAVYIRLVLAERLKK